MEIIEKKALNIVGIKEIIKEHEMFTEIPKMYTRFKELSDKIKAEKSEQLIDISFKEEGDNYIQIIGVEVENNASYEEFVSISIPSASYLYHFHKGRAETLFQVYVDMYDYALNHHLKLDKKEFKMEIKEGNIHHLYLKLDE